MAQKLYLPASHDLIRIVVVNIDNQNDFAQKGGRLFVEGSVEAAMRASSFFLNNTWKITTIMSSLTDMACLIFSIVLGGETKTAISLLISPKLATPMSKTASGSLYPTKNGPLATFKNLVQLPSGPSIAPKATPCDMVSNLSEAIAFHSYQRDTEQIWIEKVKTPAPNTMVFSEPKSKTHVTLAPSSMSKESKK